MTFTESWCTEWSKTAKELHALGDSYYEKGNFIGARKTYLRAANYYRTAEFYLHGNADAPRIPELTTASLACFSRVMELNDPVIPAGMDCRYIRRVLLIWYSNTLSLGRIYR